MPGFTFTVGSASMERGGADDRIHLTGTITCPEFLNGHDLVVEVRQGDVSARPGDVDVTCDGAEHNWTVRTYTSRSGQKWHPGETAKVTGSILFASEERDVILT